MLTYQQYRVGEISIRRDRDVLIFQDPDCRWNLHTIFLAMDAVATKIWGKHKPNPQEAFQAAFVRKGTSYYLEQTKVLECSANKKVSFFSLSRRYWERLRATIEISQEFSKLFVATNFSYITLLINVEICEDFYELEEGDLQELHELFIEFIDFRCPESGTYHFNLPRVKRRLGIPNYSIFKKMLETLPKQSFTVTSWEWSDEEICLTITK